MPLPPLTKKLIILERIESLYSYPACKPCEQCGDKEARYVASFESHIEGVSELHYFCCEVCARRYARRTTTAVS